MSQIANGKLDFGDYPSEELIGKLAKALDADLDELLLLARKIPGRIRQRIIERPKVFRRVAELGDAEMDQLLEYLEGI